MADATIAAMARSESPTRVRVSTREFTLAAGGGGARPGIRQSRARNAAAVELGNERLSPPATRGGAQAF
jgi:hypothetical protein